MRYLRIVIAVLLVALAAGGPLPAQRRTGNLHFRLKFRRGVTPETSRELSRRGVAILRYLNDSTVVASVPSDSALAGFDLEWSAESQAIDKLSPLAANGPAAAWLAIFHQDVPMDQARALAVDTGLDILPNASLLPSHLLVAGSLAQVTSLASRDAVAYILPASTDLIAGDPVMACAGPVSEAGPVGEYVEVGRGWPRDTSGNVDLHYYFENITSKLDESVVRGEVARAFREWQKFARLTLTPASQAGAPRAIDIRFAKGAHGDAYPFDGPSGVLAHTFYPVPLNSEPLAGNMHLDADEDWHAGSSIDLFSVALHEAGHALGLGHSDRPGAVMYPYYRLSTGLSSDDIAGIQDLYGNPSTTTPPVQPPPIVPPVLPPTITPPPPPPPSPSSDTTPPTLRIVSPSATIVSTGSASLKISGTATDNIGVATVKWNTSSGDTGVATGTTSWAVTVPLYVGTTSVTIRAYDGAGNSSWRSITAVRR